MRTETCLLLANLIMVFTTGCNKKPEQPPSIKSDLVGNGEPSVSDVDRLQGVWRIESVDLGDLKKVLPPDRGALFRFEGDLFTRIEAQGDPGETFTFTLDASRNPKWMTLVRRTHTSTPAQATAKEPLLREEQIYQLQGDELMVAGSIAVDLETSSRPGEFQARPWAHPQFGKPTLPGIIVWRLKKTHEPERSHESRQGTGRGGPQGTVK
jgi:uncharacterized protein (TIGR03067 family)